MNSRGSSTVGTLFTAICVFVIGFLAWQVIPFYYYYYDILGMMEAQAKKASVKDDAEIRYELYKRALKTNLPIDDADDFKINRIAGKMIIDLSYEEVLYIDLGEDRYYDIHVFDFNPHVEIEIVKKKKKRRRRK